MEAAGLADAWVVATLLFVLGAIVGSFLNVCIHRIPRKESLVRPSSRCGCGEPIPWQFNLPILSWILLRGKAACCGRKISFRYLLVEILTGAVFAFASLHFAETEFYALFLFWHLLFACILICATFIDLEHMIIPDRLSVGGTLVGVAMAFAFPLLLGSCGGGGLLDRVVGGSVSLVGILVGSGTLYWVGVLAETLLRRQAIGQGDVKLLGCVGAFCGWQGALFSIFGGALVGTALLLPLALIGSLSNQESPNQEQRGKKIGWGVEVPFGPFLAFAALLYQLGLDVFVDAYFEKILHLFQMA